MIVLRLTFEVRSELGMACIVSFKLEDMLADNLPRCDAQDIKVVRVGCNSSRCLGMSLRHDLASCRRCCGIKSIQRTSPVR
jgi:hypothetical protein